MGLIYDIKYMIYKTSYLILKPFIMVRDRIIDLLISCKKS